ncbi:Uncharacterised protein [Chlamydia trachomatis]|nr:Uncharacterised protein [Chlamydia trachomatis]
MGNHRSKAILGCKLNSVEGFGNGTNLVQLYEQGISCSKLNTLSQTLWIGDEQVIANELQTITKTLGDCCPIIPAFFLEWIFDGNDWILVDELLVVIKHVSRFALFAVETILASFLVVELRRSNIEGNTNLLSWLVTCSFDCIHDVLQGIFVGLHLWSEATFVTKTSSQAFLLQNVL